MKKKIWQKFAQRQHLIYSVEKTEKSLPPFCLRQECWYKNFGFWISYCTTAIVICKLYSHS